jgi:hypothetical protein
MTNNVLAKSNPANAAPEAKGNRKRIPMSTPVRRLEVPELAGYHMHWMRESEIPRALQAAYQFVEFDELPVNQRGVGTDTQVTGNSDMGSQIRVVGGVGQDGRTEYLVLMKLAEELWLEDCKIKDERNASIMNGIFRGEKIIGTEKDANQGDTALRYVDKERTKALFNRPARKGS